MFEDAGNLLAAIAAIMASCAGIYVYIKRALKALFDIQTKDIQKRLDEHDAAIKQVDMENCKNFLVSFLSKVEMGQEVDEIEKERFWEQYEHYSSSGGNGYIKKKVEVLCKKGLL